MICNVIYFILPLFYYNLYFNLFILINYLNHSYIFCFSFRSREKRRISDLVLETRVLELTRENSILKAELYAIKEKFGISQNQVSFFSLKKIKN